MSNRISPAKLLNTLELLYNTYLEHPEWNSGTTNSFVPMIWGAPGIGKSSIAQALASRLDAKLINFKMLYHEPSDLKGLTFIDSVNCKTVNYLPDFLPDSDSNERILFFFDEFTLLRPDQQSAVLEVLLEKRIGDYKFPKNCLFLAAGNRSEDNCNTFALSHALHNRLIHFELSVTDTKEWIQEYAIHNNFHPAVLSYISSNTHLLLYRPEDDLSKPYLATPRSWEIISHFLNTHSLEEVKPIINGIIGTLGPDFITACTELVDVPDMEKCWELAVNGDINTLASKKYIGGIERAGSLYGFQSSFISKIKAAHEKVTDRINNKTIPKDMTTNEYILKHFVDPCINILYSCLKVKSPKVPLTSIVTGLSHTLFRDERESNKSHYNLPAMSITLILKSVNGMNVLKVSGMSDFYVEKSLSL
jgi:hypothetical protein